MFTRHGLHSGHRRLGDPVKLHMTVLNSRLRSERQASRVALSTTTNSTNADQSPSESFSAVGALLTFETRHLIENAKFEEVQLCKMIADNSGEDGDGDGFYPCLAKLTWSNT